MVERNLFPYDLAIAAIFKDEGKYLAEWLDYHLLAGVEHFYLYNNDSSDDYREILAPYVEKNLVTLKNFPGKLAMYPAYNDAVENYRFECRYLAFIDLDEFIFPRTGQSILEVVDEILSENEDAAALGINFQCFGSNGQETADYSRGVSERFTRRAPRDWVFKNANGTNGGNLYIKSVVNPRLVEYFFGPHYAIYFDGLKSINTSGNETWRAGNHPITADKIVINHYFTKSREEYATKKMPKGSVAVKENYYNMEGFDVHDRNEEFDDGILKYRAARAENFSFEPDEERLRRVEKTLVEILTQCSPFAVPRKFFDGKLETFLTCRALAEKFGIKIGSRSAEEYALVWIYQTLLKSTKMTHAEVEQFTRALPEILARPFPICKKIKEVTEEFVIPSFCEAFKDIFDWGARSKLIQLQKFLRLIK